MPTDATPPKDDGQEVTDAIDRAEDELSEAREEVDKIEDHDERESLSEKLDAIAERLGAVETKLEESGPTEAIRSELAALAATVDELSNRLPAAGDAGDALEEAADAIGDGVSGFVEEIIEEIPKRAHWLFRPIFGGGKDD